MASLTQTRINDGIKRNLSEVMDEAIHNNGPIMGATEKLLNTFSRSLCDTRLTETLVTKGTPAYQEEIVYAVKETEKRLARRLVEALKLKYQV